MSLQEKYAGVISAANTAGVTDLQVREQDGVLYVDGKAPTTAAKDAVWAAYEKANPDFRASDMVLNMAVPEGASNEYTVKSGDNLSKIGKQYGKSWQEIYEKNKAVIGDNPDLIKPGQVLKIPA